VTDRSARVLLVEDNAVYRATLELLLPAERGLEIVGAVGDGEAAVAAVAALGPDVVLLDLRLPGLAGAEAVAALALAAPRTGIVCLTAEPDDGLTRAALAAGAVAVLDKALPTREIADAIRSAAHG
jgi:DNA-binding NarL/FixJ family response regulator